MTHHAPGDAPLAYIFDMDGTIVDNMHFHTGAWMRTLDRLGVAGYSPEHWERMTSGMPNHQIIRTLLKLDLDDAAINDAADFKEQAYRDLATGKLKAFSGFHGFMTRIKAAGLRTAVATGAPPIGITQALNETGLTTAFDALVGAADIKRGKPDPEIFLTAAARLGVPPERCVAFEDAPLGLESARQAGMRAIVIQGMMTDAEIAAFPHVIRTIKSYDALTVAGIAGDLTRALEYRHE